VQRKQHGYYIQLDDGASFKSYPLLVEWEEDIRRLLAWVIAVKDVVLPLVERYRKRRDQADKRHAKSLRAAVVRWQARNAHQTP